MNFVESQNPLAMAATEDLQQTLPIPEIESMASVTPMGCLVLAWDQFVNELEFE